MGKCDLVHRVSFLEVEEVGVHRFGRRLIANLIALRQNNAQRYPDDVLVRIMLEHPEDPDLQRQLQKAFGHLTGKVAATS